MLNSDQKTEFERPAARHRPPRPGASRRTALKAALAWAMRPSDPAHHGADGHQDIRLTD
jgi:hypothetical protein